MNREFKSYTERYPEPFSFSKGIFGMLYLYLLDIRSYRVHNAAETSTKESFMNGIQTHNFSGDSCKSNYHTIIPQRPPGSVMRRHCSGDSVTIEINSVNQVRQGDDKIMMLRH
jgi:hypothetical protein